MQLFFNPDISENTTQFTFEREESKHIVKVLRKNIGDTLYITNGKGWLFIAEISMPKINKCTAKIISQKQQPKRDYNLHLAVAPTKINDRYEWFLEKATEIGIDEISLIICNHSERRKVRTDRLRKILVSAMKQSLKAYLPILHEPISFKQFVQTPRINCSKYIAQGAENMPLKDNYEAPKDVLLLIGPEGDFSKQELTLAYANDFQGVNLGNSRLRTETAGIVACHTLNLLNE